MKKSLFLMLVLAPTSLFAADIAANLQGYRIGACTNWVFNSGGNMPGYICSSFPQTVTVADAYSYANTIRDLEARIVELEKKVTELQQPKPQPQQ